LSSVLAKGQAAGAVHAETADDDPATIFSRVYQENHWGRRWGRKFFSGPGSHDARVIDPYIQSLKQFLGEFPQLPDVVDLGCGDFHVGRRIRSSCQRYVACDVVPELIRHNATAFARQRVEFLCINIIDDPLPAGEVAFVRQVLQHLTNSQIAQVIPKLQQYRCLVITEHLPSDPDFIPNLDHRYGSGIRVTRGSGVVLTAPPFNLKACRELELCRIQCTDGVIRTNAYVLS